MSKRWWLCLPPLVAYSADVTATLLGQPVEYWDGNYDRPVEANPIGWWFLSISPWVAVVAAVLWAVAFTLVVLYWRYRVPTAAILTACHMFGVSSWLIRLGWPGWIGVVIAFVVVERLWAVCRRMSGSVQPTLTPCR